jgi:hypothetical protein
MHMLALETLDIDACMASGLQAMFALPTCIRQLVQGSTSGYGVMFLQSGM